MSKSRLEEKLKKQLDELGITHYKREYRFHPERKWRFDFAFIKEKVAIEVQGGIYTGGAHARGKGLERDYEKLNEAGLLGWTVLMLSSNMINSRNSMLLIKNVIEQKQLLIKSKEK